MSFEIIQIIPSLTSRGQGRFVSELTKGLKEYQDHESKILCFNDITEVMVEGQLIINFWKSYPFPSASVVHTHNIRGDLFVIVQRYFWRKKFFWVSTVHQDVVQDLRFKFGKYNIRTLMLQWVFSLTVHLPDRLVCLTEIMREHLVQSYNLERVNVIGNAISGDIFDSIGIDGKIIDKVQSFKKEGYVCLVNACNVSRGKALDQVLELLTKNQLYVYFLIGDGNYLEEFKNNAKQCCVEDRLIFLGSLPLAARYFRYFDMLLFTSYGEGFPITLLEAGLLKVPVVASRIPSLEEIYSNEHIYFFNNNDTEELESVIKNAAQDFDNKVDRMYEFIDAQYSMKKMTEDYLRIYKEYKYAEINNNNNRF